MNGQRMAFKVHSMDCAEEIAVLKREVGPLVGGEGNLAFDLLNAKMTVSEGASTSAEAVLQAIYRTGMRAEPWQDSRPHEGKTSRQWLQLALMVASGILTALAFGLHAWHAGGLGEALGSEGTGPVHAVPWFSKALYLTGIVSACWFIAPKAWLSAKRLRPDMNLLEIVAVAGAVSIGEWFEAATVSFLFAVSFVLGAWSLSRARRAVEALMDLTPPHGRSGGRRQG